MAQNAATIKWRPPESDGGSPITNYIVEMKQVHDYKWTEVNAGATVNTCEFNVTGIQEKKEYIFRVTAVNKAGQGPPSDPSSIVKYGTI